MHAHTCALDTCGNRITLLAASLGAAESPPGQNSKLALVCDTELKLQNVTIHSTLKQLSLLLIYTFLFIEGGGRIGNQKIPI